MLASFDKRLALQEQAFAIGQKAADAQNVAVMRSIDALTAEVRAAVTTFASATADPHASAAGRAVLEDLGALGIRLDRTNQKVDAKADAKAVAGLSATVEGHDDFIKEARGALKLARFALGTSLIGNVFALIAFASSLQQHT